MQIGGKNRPTLVFTVKDIMTIFGDPNMLPKNRTVRIDKNWVDAYSVQIHRTLRGRKVEELTFMEMKLLKMLLQKYLDSSWNYIFRKYCA